MMFAFTIRSNRSEPLVQLHRTAAHESAVLTPDVISTSGFAGKHGKGFLLNLSGPTWTGCPASYEKSNNRTRRESKAYAAALIDFSSVGSLISSLRADVSTFGAGIVISSTPLRNVAAASSVFAPSGSGICR
jgi:hypothetical protein